MKRIRALLLSAFVVLLGMPIPAMADGSLQIQSQPESTRWSIRIDGKPIKYHHGVEVKLSEGEHQLHAVAPGLRPIQRRIRIDKGHVRIITLETNTTIRETTKEASPATEQIMSLLVVVSDQRGAKFTIDGLSSHTPATFEVGTGRHSLRTEDASEIVEVAEGMTTWAKIDPSGKQITSFRMTEAQQAAIDAASQEEMFHRGYELYGREPGILGRLAGRSYAFVSSSLEPYLGSGWTLKTVSFLIVFTSSCILLLAFALYGKHYFGDKSKSKRLVKKKRKLNLPAGLRGATTDEKERRRATASRDRLDRRIGRMARKVALKRKRLQQQVQGIQDDENAAKALKKLNRKLKRVEAAATVIQRAIPDPGQ